jgi:protein gp37
MADVFEPRRELDTWRVRLWNLMEATPELDWLLLTKRPEHIAGKVPWERNWPQNVWLGTTTENQLWADRRIPELLKHPAAVRFLSCEPLLGPIDLSKWTRSPGRIDWVIAGGESGHKARPMQPDWIRALRDECTGAGVAFHFKQWGQWRPEEGGGRISFVRVGKRSSGRDLDGRTWDELPWGHLSTHTAVA